MQPNVICSDLCYWWRRWCAGGHIWRTGDDTAALAATLVCRRRHGHPGGDSGDTGGNTGTLVETLGRTLADWGRNRWTKKSTDGTNMLLWAHGCISGSNATAKPPLVKSSLKCLTYLALIWSVQSRLMQSNQIRWWGQ